MAPAPRRLGRSGIEVSPIGYGAFKLGRNRGTRYAEPFALPTDTEVARLIEGLLELGITFFDTAPAYGTSEERLGAALERHRDAVTISTKVGETFEDGASRYDFSATAVRASVERSLRALRTDVIDVVFIHSDGRDLEIMRGTGAVPALLDLRERGLVRAIGLSGKTVEGARAALDWADAIMVELHPEDASHAAVVAEAAARGVGVAVKKGLASGRIDPSEAIPFVLGTPGVTTLVMSSLRLEHMRANVALANGPGL